MMKDVPREELKLPRPVLIQYESLRVIAQKFNVIVPVCVFMFIDPINEDQAQVETFLGVDPHGLDEDLKNIVVDAGISIADAIKENAKRHYELHKQERNRVC